MVKSQIIQASAVSLCNKAILIQGESGVGKTSLCLQLIEKGATLIGDDGVVLVVERNKLLCSPHQNTVGKIEIRGLGIISGLPVCRKVKVACLINLHKKKTQRYPLKQKFISLYGKKIPCFDFYACETNYIQVLYLIKVLAGELSLSKE